MKIWDLNGRYGQMERGVEVLIYDVGASWLAAAKYFHLSSLIAGIGSENCAATLSLLKSRQRAVSTVKTQ